LQGTTLHPLAKWLKLEAKLSAKKARAISLSEDVKSELLELEVANDSIAAGKRIVELGLPKSSLIVLISRDKNYLTPRGDTVIEGGDKLMVMTDDKQAIKDLKVCLGMT
jgi:cell volume regulation protein A